MDRVASAAGRSLVTADVWPHPLTSAGRESLLRAVPAGTTLKTLIAAEWPGLPSKASVGGAADGIAAAVDGRPVPCSAWEKTVLDDGAIVTLRTALRGGGDSNPLRIVLLIAVVVAASYMPYLLPGILGQIAGAAVLIGGTLIVNAIVPPRVSDPPGQGESPPPVYALTGGANRARPYEPLLLVLGEHRVFPDLGAAEYTEYKGDEQYLHQIFNWGLGELEVSGLRTGDSPLDSFEEVETEWSGADGRLALFPGNVDTEAGAALEDTGWVERTTAPASGRIGIDLGGRIFRISKKGEIQRHAIGVEIEYWPEGDSWAKVSRALTLDHDSTAPYRKTLAYDLPSTGTWKVRVRRTTGPDSSDRVNDDLAWTALRSYQPDDGAYDGQTRLALRIRASGQLTGRLDRLSGLARQKIPVWDPGSSPGQAGAWTAPEASSNPAWLYRWYALGVRTGSRLAAGVGLPPDRVDDEVIKAWGAWCDAQGLSCNLVLDRTQSHAEVLTVIAQCGRGAPSWGTGRLGVVWESSGKVATALFTPGNIVAGTFEVDYVAGKTAQEIVCRYIDPDLDWQYNSVRRTMPGVLAPDRSVTLTLSGVTDRAQAAAECNLQAARQVYHRRRMRFETGAEGLAVARGDVIRLTHSLIDGGVTGRVLAGEAGRVQLTRAVTLSGNDDRMLFRLPDGVLHETGVTHPGAGAEETDEVVLATPLPDAPGSDDTSPVDILWRFYVGGHPSARVRIVGVEPAGEGRVRLEAIDEVDAYYAAATADLSVPLPAPRRRRPTVLHIALSESLIRAGRGFAVEITAALTVSGDWRGGVIRASVNGGRERTVARLVDGETAAFWISPPSGNLIVTVVPGSESAPSGTPLTVRYSIRGKIVAPAAPGNFLVDALGDGTRRFRWTPPLDPDVAGFRIRFVATSDGSTTPGWDDMTPMHNGLLTVSPYETNELRAGSWTFAIRAEDTSGLLSAEAAYIVAELPDPRLGSAFFWDCPSAQGWPGTIEGAVRSDDGMDALEGKGDYTWDDMMSWDNWTSWGLGDGDDGATAAAYTAEALDLGAELPFSLDWEGEAEGDAVLQYRTAETAEALAGATWGDYTSGALLTTRLLQLRWKITGDGSTLLRLDHLCYSLLGTASEEKFLDADTSAWLGSAADGRKIPTTLAHVTDVNLTLQSVGAGWSWVLSNKNDPTRIKIFNGDGNAADAVVDAVVHGIRS